jgi:hypothetical protein
MKMSILIALFALSTVSAFAAEGRVVVNCGSTPFDDIRSIQIQETATAGQYRLVQTLASVSRGEATKVASESFSMDAIEGSRLPALADWYGYSRKLVRNGRDNYEIDFADECSSSTILVYCKDSF